MRRSKLDDAILKVALGCRVEEIVEEYSEVDGEMKLTKRKETKKDIPPDLKAVQMIIGNKESETDLSTLSDEELEKEKLRLLEELKSSVENKKKSEGDSEKDGNRR